MKNDSKRGYAVVFLDAIHFLGMEGVNQNPSRMASSYLMVMFAHLFTL